MKLTLWEQTTFRLSETIGIENYFHQEINQRKLCSKKLGKYVSAFDYIDKILIVLSAASSGVGIISSASVVGAPIGIESASFTLIFSLATGIIKKLLSITRNRKKKHDKILMLAKRKLDSIETLVSQALIDMEISHEEFNAIIREKQKYERTKKMWGVSVSTAPLKNKKMWDWIVLIQKKITSLWIFYINGDLIGWKTLFFHCKFEQKLLSICVSKKKFCVCVYA